MTARQAWTYLAKSWEGAAKAGRWQITIEGFEHNCLCFCMSALCHAGRISSPLFWRMRDALEPLPRGVTGYCWPCTVAGAAKRAAFCRKMAKVRA